MKERERIIITGLVVLMLILWLGFLFHRSPRFAGSLTGGVLGVSGATLMLVPLAYLIIKRVKPLKRWVTQFVSMRTLLTWHIYAGILGPILVILHSGHKFNSPLGIALTAMTLIVVLSGFVGRYMLTRFADTIKEKKEILTQMEIAYRHVAGELSSAPDQVSIVRPISGFFSRWIASIKMLRGGSQQTSAALRALALADSIANVEYAIKTHSMFKAAFQWWLKFHITIAFILYTLLALHIWSGIDFGLRWFS